MPLRALRERKDVGNRNVFRVSREQTGCRADAASISRIARIARISSISSISPISPGRRDD
ncbi:hypothetical protein WS73_02595 [Burkholderia savannae]|uniref:hypothetical protein n=1 Tax=Burkholderia savannae TaxID=1637837 RepID=UPI0007641955|nr:hypothetical protein [Burkholderia savannae]KWZ47493.1 hypothetical protein WS73_02595 [Burkholderia savannae]